MDYVSRLKARKSELGMTNEQLSAKSGIPMGTLSKLLAGMNDSPKLGNLVALCTALGLSLDYAVFGKPENTHNFTLTSDEIALISKYRALDARGRSTVSFLLQKEAELVLPQNPSPTAQITRPLKTARTQSTGKKESARYLPLYTLPVSAGTGTYLDESRSTPIRIPPQASAEADYLLRISGNSMEPKYHDKDLVLVSRAESVEDGEIGIFILNGEGFIKVWGGDRLISLNSDYTPIPVSPADSLLCCGRVVGRLKAKRT